MKGKRGAVNWTIGKLLNIILLIVVLVLIVYGMTTGGLNPLIDNLGAKFDEVQILMGFEDSFYEGCYSSKISDLDKGDDFLKSLGVGGNDAFLEICRDGACTVNGTGIGAYRLIDGKIDEFENGGWGSFNVVDSVIVGKNDWERYDAGVGLLGDMGLKRVYDSAFTRRFVLYGDGSGANGEVFAVWQNGEWIIQEEGEGVFHSENDEDAIDAFVKLVWARDGNDNDWARNDDKVIWSNNALIRMDELPYVKDSVSVVGLTGKEACKAVCDGKRSYRLGKFDSTYSCDGVEKLGGTCCCYKEESSFYFVGENGKNGESIGNLVGTAQDDDEIDSEEDVNNLKMEFRKISGILLSEVEISDEETKELKNAVVGKSVFIDGKEFVVDTDMVGEFPVVSFSSSDGESFGLKFAAFGKTRSSLIDGINLNYFPVYLVEKKNGEWVRIGDEEVYRLPKAEFDKIYFGNLVSKFLRSKCK